MKEKLLALLTDKPQSRELLCIKLQVSDRKLRKAVEDLRREGHPICSSSHRKGYWMGDSADRKMLVREYRARGAKMFDLANKLEAGAGRRNANGDLQGISKNDRIQLVRRDGRDYPAVRL